MEVILGPMFSESKWQYTPPLEGVMAASRSTEESQGLLGGNPEDFPFSVACHQKMLKF